MVDVFKFRRPDQCVDAKVRQRRDIAEGRVGGCARISSRLMKCRGSRDRDQDGRAGGVGRLNRSIVPKDDAAIHPNEVLSNAVEDSNRVHARSERSEHWAGQHQES